MCVCCPLISQNIHLPKISYPLQTHIQCIQNVRQKSHNPKQQQQEGKREDKSKSSLSIKCVAQISIIQHVCQSYIALKTRGEMRNGEQTHTPHPKQACVCGSVHPIPQILTFHLNCVCVLPHISIHTHIPTHNRHACSIDAEPCVWMDDVCGCVNVCLGLWPTQLPILPKYPNPYTITKVDIDTLIKQATHLCTHTSPQHNTTCR